MLNEANLFQTSEWGYTPPFRIRNSIKMNTRRGDTYWLRLYFINNFVNDRGYPIPTLLIVGISTCLARYRERQTLNWNNQQFSFLSLSNQDLSVKTSSTSRRASWVCSTSPSKDLSHWKTLQPKRPSQTQPSILKLKIMLKRSKRMEKEISKLKRQLSTALEKVTKPEDWPATWQDGLSSL